MPLGSSSEAPVISPGPNFWRNVLLFCEGDADAPFARCEGRKGSLVAGTLGNLLGIDEARYANENGRSLISQEVRYGGGEFRPFAPGREVAAVGL